MIAGADLDTRRAVVRGLMDERQTSAYSDEFLQKYQFHAVCPPNNGCSDVASNEVDSNTDSQK